MAQGQSVSWGKVTAGAALATGAVLMGVAVSQGEVPILSEIYAGLKDIVKGLFSGLAGESATAITAIPQEPGIVSKAFANFGEIISEHAKALSGAALMGGALAYFGFANDKRAVAVPVHDMEATQMGFAAREQMRAVNALMQSRMVAMNPEYAAQFQQGPQR